MSKFMGAFCLWFLVSSTAQQDPSPAAVSAQRMLKRHLGIRMGMGKKSKRQSNDMFLTTYLRSQQCRGVLAFSGLTRAESKAVGEINLEWNKASIVRSLQNPYPVSGCPRIVYYIYAKKGNTIPCRAGKLPSFFYYSTTTYSSSYTLKGLEPGQTYSVLVKACISSQGAVLISSSCQTLQVQVRSSGVLATMTKTVEATSTTAASSKETTTTVATETSSVGTTDTEAVTTTTAASVALGFFQLTTEDEEAWDVFGSSVAIDGDYIVVGAAAWPDDNFGYDGRVYVFERSGLEWVLQARIFPDGQQSSAFGTSVAIDGDTIAVYNNQPLDEVPEIYVFVKNGDGTWAQEASLSPPDKSSQWGNGIFNNIDISNDILVAGYKLDRGSGRAYVYVRNGSTWTQQADLVNSDAGTGLSPYFGMSVAVDNGVVAVGSAMYNWETSVSYSGVYIFNQDGDTWIESQKLDTTTWPDKISMSRDIIAVRPLDIFNLNGKNWVKGDPLGPNIDEYFMTDLVSVEGNRLVVFAEHSEFATAGKIFVFEKSGSATWEEVARLPGDGGFPADMKPMALGSSMNTVVMSHVLHKGENSSVVYVLTV